LLGPWPLALGPVPTGMTTPPIHVAVAVIQDDQGRVLLSRRPEGVHQGGLWEFPGGKLEEGEDLAQGLIREIREELGLRVISYRPLISVVHHYPDKSVKLDVHRVTDFVGTPHGREGQPLAWVAPDALTDYPMPAADGPIINAVRLPDTYLITGPDPEAGDSFLKRLEHVLCRGVRLVQFRAPGLNRDAFIGLAHQALKRCREHGAALLLNGDPEWVKLTGADGVHLNSRRLTALESRPLGSDQWVGASCHNAVDLHHAQRLGLDFAVLSPVMPTGSHPDARPMGWSAFQQLVSKISIPVFALGGMERGHLVEAWDRGAQGIAGIRGVGWGNTGPRA